MRGEKKSLIIIFVFCVFISAGLSVLAKDLVLKAEVSIDRVPKEFYGTWRVSSKLVSTNSEGNFKESNIDLWNLSRVGNVITLSNPFSGAKASIVISNIDGRAIKFSKIGNYDGNKLTDTVELVLGKETFSGTNNLKLDTISGADGTVINTKRATYKLSGEKISGETVK